MKLATKSISKTLPLALKSFRPARSDVEIFRLNCLKYFDRIDSSESEENLKTHLMDLLKSIFSPHHLVEQQGSIDFVIRTGGKNTPAAVLVEAKRASNKADMIRTDDLNRKALHELVLYYMQSRDAGNTDIQHLMICTEHEIYAFDASCFERHFFGNTTLRRDFLAWKAGKKSLGTTDFFYREIAAPYIATSDATLEATHIDLRTYEQKIRQGLVDRSIVDLFKFLGPHCLLQSELQGDGNVLNVGFYDELMHLLGLEEKKDGSKRVIGRPNTVLRQPGSLIENTISQIRAEDEFNSPEIIREYGANNSEREFRIALELALTWINRLLFLKLLEAQLLRFHRRDPSFRFLVPQLVGSFDELSDLFFKVLAVEPREREPHIQAKYGRVPYLNSSLFELTPLEKRFRLTALSNGLEIPVFRNSVLRDATGHRLTGTKVTLTYVLEFLDAYDFGAVGGDELQDEKKTIINAAVLGLIFEKINGYREGAIFTPGYVTMYMARKVIERTVLDAFRRENPNWILNDVADLNNNIADRSRESILRLNAIIDRIKICDPAVGSGHFLVSCLNEMIALKSRLGILADAAGNRLSEYEVGVDNDELLVLRKDSDQIFTYEVVDGVIPKGLQAVQVLLFSEKQKLIENSLFGVDINPNSVRICQLRLWIELLKSAYYRDGQPDQLETLPNIDINIKCGNSLLSRFRLDQNLSEAFRRANLTVTQYRQLVQDYKHTRDKGIKRQLQESILRAKAQFRDEVLGRVTAKINAEIKALEADEAQADLFTLDSDLRSQREAVLAEIRSNISDLRARREQLLLDQAYAWAFEWRFEFPEVLGDKGQFEGFDIIIANPPYMRVQDIAATQPVQKEFYERDYRTASGAYDLANLFFELAVRLSKVRASNSIFIFPHKLFNSKNGSALREYLANSRSIKHVTHFGANQIFDGVTTYTCIALFNDVPADGFQFKRLPLGSDLIQEMQDEQSYVRLTYDEVAKASALYGDNQWIFFDDPKGFDAFERIYRDSVRLSDRLSAFVGLQTSRDSLFVVKRLSETADTYRIVVNPEGKAEKPPIETKELVVEKRFFKPFLMGKDVHRFAPLSTDRLVFFPYELDGYVEPVSLDTLKTEYRKTFDFVDEYEAAFKAREDNKAATLTPWYRYIYEKNLSKFEQEKLVSMEICSKHPNVTIDTNAIYHTTKVYSFVKKEGVSESLTFFMGLLNSELFWWFLKITGDTLQGDARTMKTNYVNPFPIPARVDGAGALAVSNAAAELIRARGAGACASDLSELERDLSTAVYNLYGVSPDEIETIRSALGLPPLEVVDSSVAQY